MINYYEILNVSPLDDQNTVIFAYRQIISNYNYNNLSNNDINEIKLLKRAKYILTNPTLKNKYDYLLYKSTQVNQPTNLKKEIVSIPLPENDNDNTNDFNNVFNVDNNWMNNNEFINNNTKDNELDNNLINGRIFDLSEIYNRQIKYEDMPQIKNTRDDK